MGKDDFSKYMNPPVDDGLKKQIDEKAEALAGLIRDGYVVTIYPAKNGIKITSHKERVVK